MNPDRQTQSTQVLENDSRSLRVEIRPDTDISPIRAAWLLGRICNEMRFRFEHAWILYADCEPDRTIELWVVGRVLIGRTQGTQHAPLLDAFERARNSWEKSFTSEWHSEKISDETTTLQRSIYDGEPLPSDHEVDFLAEICVSVTRIISELAHQLSVGLQENARSAFALGQIADELIHPPLSSRVLSIIPASPAIMGSWSEALSHSPREQRGLTLPNRIAMPWPNPEWRRMMAYRIAEFCQANRWNSGPPTLSWNAETSNHQILSDLDGMLNEADARTQIADGQRTPSAALPVENPSGESPAASTIDRNDKEWVKTSVGLYFHRGTQTVRKGESGKEITDQTRLNFNVLLQIALKGNSYSTRRDLENEWEKNGGSSDGENAIDCRLTAIRQRILKPLEMKLENKRDVGWRIVAAGS